MGFLGGQASYLHPLINKLLLSNHTVKCAREQWHGGACLSDSITPLDIAPIGSYALSLL